MSGRSPTVTRLFWVCVAGGGAALWYGRPALVATGSVLAVVLLYRLDRPRRVRAAIRRVVRRHARTLALRRRQERFVDAYGTMVEDGWLREREYFAERTLIPALEARGFAHEAENRWDEILAVIERIAAAEPLPPEDEAPEDGIGYERYCAGLLTEAGWRARPTRASHDQGADIIAEHGNTRLVVQCKRYGKPVGNGAVQEVAAAARHWSGDLAAVVSNAGFTPAARKLAASTGVILLHHDDLPEFGPDRARNGAPKGSSHRRASARDRGSARHPSRGFALDPHEG